MSAEKKEIGAQKYRIEVEPIFGSPQKPQSQFDIFVLMPFDPKLKPIYTELIVNIAKKLNIKINRVDDFKKTGSIISDIWTGIVHSKLIIADCTNRNANVFYEIGIAHTLGKKVIMITQNSDDIPFDTKQFRYIKYTLTSEGMQNFEKELSETLKNELALKEKLISIFISYSEEDIKQLDIVHLVNLLHGVPEIKNIQTKLPKTFENETILNHLSTSFKGKDMFQWIEWTKKANQASDVFIIVCSEVSIKSEKAKKERYIANKYHKLIIPLYEDIKYLNQIYPTHKLEAINIKEKNIEQIVEKILEIIRKAHV